MSNIKHDCILVCCFQNSKETMNIPAKYKQKPLGILKKSEYIIGIWKVKKNIS